MFDGSLIAGWQPIHRLDLVGNNGSGMHCHQSLAKAGAKLFTGDHYGGDCTPSYYSD